MSFFSLPLSSSEAELSQCQAIIFRQKHRVSLSLLEILFSRLPNFYPLGFTIHKYGHWAWVILFICHANCAIFLIFRGPKKSRSRLASKNYSMVKAFLCSLWKYFVSGHPGTPVWRLRLPPQPSVEERPRQVQSLSSRTNQRRRMKFIL